MATAPGTATPLSLAVNANIYITTATFALAAKTANLDYHMSAAVGYIHGATITDSGLRQSYVIAHELTHVEYAETATGHASLEQSYKGPRIPAG